MFKGLVKNFLLGYRVIRPENDCLSYLISELYKHGIPFKVRNENIYLSGFEFKRAINMLEKNKIKSYSAWRGLTGFVKRLSSKKGVVFALTLLSVLFFFSYNTVFDIRINGIENLTEKKVLSQLEESGFSIGKSWFSTDIQKVESSILKASDDIGWININRRGSVAYVEIREKELKNTATYSYSNIIAGNDCIIEDITVTCGYARVKVGDTVKKGDVLISGVPENSTELFCAAEGSVIGRVNDTVCAYESRMSEEKIPKYDGIVGFSIKIFKKNINIFKLYGNSTKEYDIIENEYEYKLFGKRIPVSFSTFTKTDYEIIKTEKTDEELILSVRMQTADLVLSVTDSSDLLSLRSRGRFTDDGYVLYTDVVFLKDVSITVPFDLE